MDKQQVIEHLRKAGLTFFLGPRACGFLSEHMRCGEMVLSHSPGTRIEVAEEGGKGLWLLGDYVDSHAECAVGAVARDLLRSSGDIDSLLGNCERLAGKFVAIARFGERFFLFNDAFGLFPVHYSFPEGKAPCASSLEYLLAQELNLPLSKEAARILRRAEPGMPLPGDLDRYEGSKFLLANHMLNLTDRTCRRFFPAGRSFRETAASAARKTVELTGNIIRQYGAEGGFLCPLTGGWDSRLVLSLLLHNRADVTCYTTIKPHFTEKDGDVWVPREIAKRRNIGYSGIQDTPPTEEALDFVEEIFGHRRYAQIQSTHEAHWPGLIRVGGDIIDQIGKSAIGSYLPGFLAVPSFFLCKSHTYSFAAWRRIARWCGRADVSGSGLTKYELYAWEHRAGRWVALTSSVLAVLGVREINLFNCREMMNAWVGVPRGDRIHNEIHREVFKITAPDLMDIPFNPGVSTDRIKQIPILFWAGTYTKYFRMMAKFFLRGARGR
jgi:hypothetical protein